MSTQPRIDLEEPKAAGRVTSGSATTGPQPLAAALRLFGAFDEAGVRYCHFKSNEHLLDGLAGLTDLDVLVDRHQAQAVQGALQVTGYKRFSSWLSAAYPGVEDYLGFDAEGGRLVHLHLHYALVVGEKHLKGYQLDPAPMLGARVVDADTGVHTSDPDHELQLLLLRFALKLRWRDHPYEWLGRRFFRGSALREYRWLQARVDRERLRRLAEVELGPRAAACVDALAAAPPSARQLRALRRGARSTLQRCRTYGPLESRLLRIARELHWLLAGFGRRWLGRARPLRRTSPRGGRIIAFLGADGSGKSTLVREIGRWLSWKLDVSSIYFGSGDGPSSWSRWTMKLPLRLVRRTRGLLGLPQPTPGAEAAHPREPRRVSPAKAIWAVSLALEKRARMRAAIRARNRGMMVLCDRYPQIHVMGFNDGPLLAPWLESPWRALRGLARWEYGVYVWIAATPPDLVVKLDVAPEVSLARKPGTRFEIERRREAVRQMDFGSSCEHVVVDASRPFDEVLVGVKRAVWDRI